MKLNTIFLILIFNSSFFAILHCQKSEIAKDSIHFEDLIQEYDNFNQNKDYSNWNQVDTTSLNEQKLFFDALLTALNKIEVKNLTPEQVINKDILSLIVSDKAYQLEYQSYLFPLNSEGGFFTNILYSIRSRKVDDSISFENYCQDLRSIPEYFDQQKLHLQKGIAENKMMPKLVVQHCIDNLQGILSAGPEASFFLDPIKVDGEMRNEVIDIVRNEVFPSYWMMSIFLSEVYLPSAPAKIGVSEMKDGKRFYEQRVRFYTTYDISPQEVFDIGMAEVKRIRAEMEHVILQTGFDGDFDSFLNFLRTDPQFYAQSSDELLKEAAWIAKKMEGMMPKYFGKMPRMPLTVTPVPSALAPNYTSGRYSPGSYENNKPGEYWVNTYDLKSRPLYALPALSLHEGIPGHHTQIMLASELENLPAFRSFYLSAFGEGWALYTEFLGKEAGIYDDAYKEFGRLTYEMWRACRLVVDPGMHYMGWTREEALKFMSENTALSFREVNAEIDRYIGWPGQAVSYKMGELKIRELRKKSEAALGDQFDIKEFHDLILSQGSVPMSSLETMVNVYLRDKQK